MNPIQSYIVLSAMSNLGRAETKPRKLGTRRRTPPPPGSYQALQRVLANYCCPLLSRFESTNIDANALHIKSLARPWLSLPRPVPN